MIRYQAEVFKDGKSYSVIFPDLPGCFSSGLSKDRALSNAREALSLYLENARDEKWVVPPAKARQHTRFVWITPYTEVAIPLMIRTARRNKGLSQRELANRIGITVQQLQKLETPGKSNPTIKTLSTISEALDSKIDIRLVA